MTKQVRVKIESLEKEKFEELFFKSPPTVLENGTSRYRGMRLWGEWKGGSAFLQTEAVYSREAKEMAERISQKLKLKGVPHSLLFEKRKYSVAPGSTGATTITHRVFV